MSISIRHATLADIDIADPIVMAAYNIQSARMNLQRNMRIQPDGWFLVFLDERPVGFGGITGYGAFAYVGMISTHPDVQRRGIGRILMEELHAWARQQSCSTILLDASDVGAKLYTALGYQEDDTVGIFACDDYTPLAASEPPPVEHLTPAHLTQIATFDEAFFGANRTNVITTFLQEYPERGFVTRDANGLISGYLIAQTNILGPWVASNATDAERLLRQALTLSYNGTGPATIFSPTNSNALAILTRYGFTQKNLLTHMRYGPKPERRRTMIYGQTNFALG